MSRDVLYSDVLTELNEVDVGEDESCELVFEDLEDRVAPGWFCASSSSCNCSSSSCVVWES